MAFNWQTFKTRALTAIVFVIVMLAGLLWNRWSFFVLFSIVHFGAWAEYQKLVGKFNPQYNKISSLHRYGIMIGGWCLLLFFTNHSLKFSSLTLTDVGFWMGIAFMISLPLIMLIDSRIVFFGNIAYSIVGVIYISLPLGLLMELRTHWSGDTTSLSYTIPLLIIFSLWINDTMAYIVGSLIGKTPLSKISPKKTWEGTAGGVLLTVVVICLITYFTKRISIVDAGVMSGVAAIAGTLGDLFESKLKRMAGVKDSGSIMPGHGGFLDRFDSLLFAAVFVWLYAAFAL
ncbi:MAG TPA: phosphatidate cytidylyltransferase [Flavisolibacter sp.]|jgi:phosphatidate cytidylyltransferase|nr:phosphatidate cytidylyltransferase [Flavisolibacter sp.]